MHAQQIAEELFSLLQSFSYAIYVSVAHSRPSQTLALACHQMTCHSQTVTVCSPFRSPYDRDPVDNKFCETYSVAQLGFVSPTSTALRREADTLNIDSPRVHLSLGGCMQGCSADRVHQICVHVVHRCCPLQPINK